MDEFIDQLFTTKVGKNIDPEIMIQLLEEYRDNIEYDCSADDAFAMFDEIIDDIKEKMK